MTEASLFLHFAASGADFLEHIKKGESLFQLWRSAGVWRCTPADYQVLLDARRTLAQKLKAYGSQCTPVFDDVVSREIDEYRGVLERINRCGPYELTEHRPHRPSVDLGRVFDDLARRPFRTAVYLDPKDVLEEWGPIFREASDIWVIDPYATAASGDRKGDEQSEVYARAGLNRFADALIEAKDRGRSLDSTAATATLTFVTCWEHRRQAETGYEAPRLRSEVEEAATSRLRSWLSEDVLRRLSVKAVVLSKARKLNLHDRFFIFARESTTDPLKWAFAAGRGISAFANDHSALTVSMLEPRWIPAGWLPYD